MCFILADVMDVKSNQTIYGTKTFTNKIMITGNLNVNKYLDNVDIEHLLHHTMMYNVTQNVTGRKSFDSLSTSSINLLNCTDQSCPLWDIFSKLKNDTVKRTDQNIKVNGTKTFSNGSIIHGDLTVNGTIGGLQFPGDFLLQDANQTINATYTFTNVSFLNNLTTDFVNGVNLTDLYERVLRKSGHPQTVTGYWLFNESSHFNRVVIDGLVDGVNLSRDGLLTNQNHSFTGEKTFYNGAHFDKLFAKNLTVTGLIDGVNLTSLKEELVTNHSKDVIITGTKIFENEVSFAGNLTVLGLIDGVNISDLNRRAVKLDLDQVITGQKVYHSSFSITTADIYSRIKLYDFGHMSNHISLFIKKA